ncbi:hypothetical protein TCAL_16483 [Tigriopus californicus]|uniref:Uncharacterized protein n=1 Tax=Tigriopus californicus TaxID=6832 RepID=A0A553NUD7_TIGCA|nr:hypothetical protein TCAL_16483 [Tigriopus californicus]
MLLKVAEDARKWASNEIVKLHERHRQQVLEANERLYQVQRELTDVLKGIPAKKVECRSMSQNLRNNK